ncbi:MOSC domain-containing protein [Ferrimonas marina]|uniref:MOSC domain-containing protein n=1 Tax=Ferrimonas marina TaxID=299255 RepID=A0A1M5X4P7_9GAMM|nr:MOSC N-terminal beta barrel domain-containing protein [Ferrimonas marina]SHH94488.1 hypothetical protein SAMN02745129_3204 [Ferrimonas marina]
MRVTQLYRYPVKSLQGIAVDQLPLTETGLPWDRHWMLVDANGRFVTQRQLPAMARIATEITQDSLLLRCGDQRFAVPLQQSPQASTPIRVWQSEMPALDEGAAASHWLTEQLGAFRGAPLRLVRFDPQQTRAIKPKYLQAGESSSTHFADGFPYLVASQQSLDGLNQQLQAKGCSPVEMARFRANVVIDGFERPFQELERLTLQGPNWRLALRKPCERCPVTTIDQQTGERIGGKEPLSTLMAMDPLADGRAYFGGNAVLISHQGEAIRVGDAVTFSLD